MPNRFFTFWTSHRKSPAAEETISIEPIEPAYESAPADEPPYEPFFEPAAEPPVVLEPPVEPEPMEPIPQPPETTYITGPIVQSEQHTLLLLFAEDFYHGHAEVQITLDDQPVFSKPHHVTARRERMQQEVITIRGEWNSPPRVGIIFANDLWHGTDDTDRNLFFYGGSYDGFKIPIEHKFFRNGTIHFVPEIA